MPIHAGYMIIILEIACISEQKIAFYKFLCAKYCEFFIINAISAIYIPIFYQSGSFYLLLEIPGKI